MDYKHHAYMTHVFTWLLYMDLLYMTLVLYGSIWMKNVWQIEPYNTHTIFLSFVLLESTTSPIEIHQSACTLLIQLK